MPAAGQRWTDLDALRADEHTARIEDRGFGLVGVGSTPKFAIGQRALLVKTDSGNFLRDCAAYLDDEIVARIGELGGITGEALPRLRFGLDPVPRWSKACLLQIHRTRSNP